MKKILVGGAAIMMMFGAAVANAQTQGSPAAAQTKDDKAGMMDKNMSKDGMSKDGMAKDGMSKNTTGTGMSNQTKTEGSGSANKK
jgi:hypothetical protein